MLRPMPLLDFLYKSCSLQSIQLMLVCFLLFAGQSTSAAQSDEPADASESKIQKLWNKLAEDGAPQAFQAIWQLVETPKETSAFLSRQLKASQPPDAARIDQLIRDLNSDSYSIRTKASQELARLGSLAKKALEDTLTDPPSPESYLRVKQLLRKLSWAALPSDELQVWRALEVLEHIGDDYSQKILERLARGSTHQWQTMQARSTLKRIQTKIKPITLAKKIVDVATLEGHTSRIYGLAFSPDNKLLASAGADSHLKLWNAADGKLVADYLHPAPVWAVDFTPDCKYVVSGCSDGNIRIWELASGKEFAVLRGHNNIVYSLSIGPDGKMLASGGADNTVRLWDLPNQKQLTAMTGHDATVWSVAISADGRTIVSGSSDRTVRLWELITGRERAVFHGHTNFIRSVSFNPDCNTVASSDSGGTVKIWNLAGTKPSKNMEAHAGGIRHLTFSRDGGLLATAGVDRTVKLWNPNDGKQLRLLEGHTDKARAAAFRPDGMMFASGSYDKSIKLWKLTD